MAARSGRSTRTQSASIFRAAGSIALRSFTAHAAALTADRRGGTRKRYTRCRSTDRQGFGNDVTSAASLFAGLMIWHVPEVH